MSPTRSDMREPKMIVERTSRPWSSVPRRYVGFPFGVHAGGVNASSRFSVFRSNGLCGAIHGAKSAARMKTAVTVAARMVRGERLKLWKISPSKKRRSVSTMASFAVPESSGTQSSSSASPRGAALDAQPWIDQVIEHVHDQVDHDEDEADEAEVRRHHRDVGELHRLDE